MNSDIASNLVAEEKSRGVLWRFFGASLYSLQKIAETSGSLAMLPGYAFQHACKSVSKESLTFSDSSRCCGAFVVLNHPDQVNNATWFKVGYFFDRDGSEANVFVWSAPERQFIRRSREWFEARL